MVGLDKRYNELDVHINKDLSFPTYNHSKYMKELNKLYKNKIVTKKI